MLRRCHLQVLAAALVLFGIASNARADEVSQQELRRKIDALAWQSAPSVGAIGKEAQVRLTPEVRFLDAANSNIFIQLNGNPPATHAYTIAPPSIDWFALFEFDESGYVHDDEKIDADELLKSLKEQNAASIEERKRLNLKVLRLVGWSVPPHYDTDTKRLEWGTKLVSDGNEETVNYSIRILGRSGVMRVLLVSDPPSLDHDVAALRTVLRGFDFVPGQRYTEFRSGDKVAEYGLGALIIGGAAAVAAKAGFGKILLKFGVFLLAAGAGVVAFIKRMFSRNRNSNTGA